MSEVTIRCRENGPLVVEGPIRVVDHLGNAFMIPTNKPAVALCRCGQSANRPFCDGSHKKVNFCAAEAACAPAVAPHQPDAQAREASR
jgi:CDGSH-type Zn-finger protein